MRITCESVGGTMTAGFIVFVVFAAFLIIVGAAPREFLQVAVGIGWLLAAGITVASIAYEIIRRM